jgi:hypothetical protein
MRTRKRNASLSPVPPSINQQAPLCAPRRAGHAAALTVRAAATVSTNDFKTGLTVELDGTPFKVIGALLVWFFLRCFVVAESSEWDYRVHTRV